MPTITPSTYANQLFGIINNPSSNLDDLVDYFDLKDPKGLHNGIRNTVGCNPHLVDIEPTLRALRSRFKHHSNPWGDMAVHYATGLVAMNGKAGGATEDIRLKAQSHLADVTVASQTDLINCFFKWLLSINGATGAYLPLLYQLCRDLKSRATIADEYKSILNEKTTRLEEASRVLLKCFSGCVNDRHGEAKESRRMGTYWMATILFKTYNKIGSTALCKNIIKGIEASKDHLPTLIEFPRADRVAYGYYMGLFAFLREDMVEAERQFLDVLDLCYSARATKRKMRNIELILDYLTPILLLRGVHPSRSLLQKPFFSRVAEVYRPFIDASRTGNVELYERKLRLAERRLMQRNTYLVVEKGREVADRRLLKTAWILSGKPAKIPIEMFRKVYELGSFSQEERNSGEQVESDEIECLLANMIFNGYIKGYISHQHQVVVLAKNLPFPWYGPFRKLTEGQQSARTAQETATRIAPVNLDKSDSML